MLEMSKPSAAKTPTVDGRKPDKPVNAYAQHRLGRWLEDNPGKTDTDFARASGLANSFVHNLKTKGTGVGFGAARALAKMFDMTLAEFVAEADRYFEENQPKKKAQPLKSRKEWAGVRAEAIALGAKPSDLDAIGELGLAYDYPLTAERVLEMIKVLLSPEPGVRKARR